MHTVGLYSSNKHLQ